MNQRFNSVWYFENIKLKFGKYHFLMHKPRRATDSKHIINTHMRNKFNF